MAVIEPHDPKGEGRGRPPIGVERMLRMYIAQQCFGLSDEGAEDAIYDSQAIRRFVGIDLTREAAPDATTLLKFRRLLEEKQLTAAIFDTINAHLAEKGLALRAGTIVDATLIAAPPSTKNKDKSRDPDMVSGDESEPRTTKKGKNWHFVRDAHPRPSGSDRHLRGVLRRHEAGWWHEGAHRGGCRIGAGAYGDRHTGQCERRHAGAGLVAWQATTCLATRAIRAWTSAKRTRALR